MTIDQLVDTVEEIAGIELQRSYDLDAPQGVRGRNSDNTRFRETYGWEPSISLREGLEKTYAWISEQVAAELATSSTSRTARAASAGADPGAGARVGPDLGRDLVLLLLGGVLGRPLPP